MGTSTPNMHPPIRDALHDQFWWQKIHTPYPIQELLVQPFKCV